MRLEYAVEAEIDLLKGMAAVAYIMHEKSRLRLRISWRGADLIFLLYSASILLLKTPLRPILDTQYISIGFRCFFWFVGGNGPFIRPGISVTTQVKANPNAFLYPLARTRRRGYQSDNEPTFRQIRNVGSLYGTP